MRHKEEQHQAEDEANADVDDEITGGTVVTKARPDCYGRQQRLRHLHHVLRVLEVIFIDVSFVVIRVRFYG